MRIENDGVTFIVYFKKPKSLKSKLADHHLLKTQ